MKRSESIKREVKEGLTTKTYSFHLTPNGGVQTSRKTGRKIIYRWGEGGILRPSKVVPGTLKSKPSLSR